MKVQKLFKRFAAGFCGAVTALTAAVSAMPMTAHAAGQSASKQVSEEIGLACNLFCTSNSDQADCAAIQWATTLSASNYVLYRSTNAESGFEPVYEGSGCSYEDDRLDVGTEYFYQLKAVTDKGEQYSGVHSLKPCALPSGLSTYDNQKGSNLVYETNGYKVGNTYYSYSLKKHAGKNDIYLAETTSTDGRHFGNERNVADSSQNSALASCKIESVHIDYRANINKVVVWAHWEQPDGYKDGKALVITGTPGGQFTVHHVYNPLDIQVRDMAFFFDDDADQTGYLIAAANTKDQGANATMYIFRMNKDYSDVTAVVKKLFENQYREFPNMIKKNGYYFLFTSQAAGWYPSSGAYAVTKDIAGTWSGLRSIGNSSTFSSQSGWIVNLQDQNYLMHAYRWLRASESSGTTLCPLYFDNSFAFYDYYPYFKYNTSTGDLYPMQQGTLLSQDHPASASIPAEGKNAAYKAFDGSYQTSFTAVESTKKWPFYLEVDLERVCELANIQISWYICKGSEGYYAYTVEGSTDGQNWTKLLDHTDTSKEIVSKTYGFNSDMLSGTARYVRLNVKSATLQNNPTNNWYNPTVYEVKIYGKPIGEIAPVSRDAAAAFDFEQANGKTVPDTTGNGHTLTLYGNTAVQQDAARGNVLWFGGTASDYAATAAGLLDGCRSYTICMDAKSTSDGNFFTFATGQDENQYAFFKIAEDHFRFQTTVDTWRGETGMRYDLDATDWHSYALSVTSTSCTLYVDGTAVAEVSDLNTSPADMGSNQKFLLGKSFYKDDVGYSGYLDNVAVYRTALTAEEIRALHNPAQHLQGDVNADGSVNTADAVAMTKFLSANGTLADWEAGDLDGDSRITAKDLTLLKRILLR
ncbi:MAG: discoidin domain-containing protein [Oscillospiraceae bacterium]|nr:discoidin domain-containing protein [Oscillospiraceae bacterium]